MTAPTTNPAYAPFPTKPPVHVPQPVPVPSHPTKAIGEK